MLLARNPTAKGPTVKTDVPCNSMREVVVDPCAATPYAAAALVPVVSRVVIEPPVMMMRLPVCADIPWAFEPLVVMLTPVPLIVLPPLAKKPIPGWPEATVE